MSKATVKQIRYWMKVVMEMQKGIDRKNKYINRLQRENSLLVKEVAELKLYQAENQLEREWVSIEDRLPENSKLVIATYINSCGNRRTIAGYYLYKYANESNGEDDSSDEYCEDDETYYYCEGWYEQQDNWNDYAFINVHEGKVTHWQNKPESPKVGE